jgi:RNA polymerase sigma factor (sigma-70 family)
MSEHGSITHWIAALKEGNASAAQPLWERYHARLVALARQRLQASPRRSADEEDVAQDAFQSFFQGVQRGRFPRLDDRDDLWRILVCITARKAYDQLRHERSQRQGGGTVLTESRIYPAGSEDETALQQIVGEEPTPAFAAQVAEQYQRLIGLLGEESLRKVAVWKMEGYTNDEIAEKLGCSLRTVARKLEAIRIIWEKEEPA